MERITQRCSQPAGQPDRVIEPHRIEERTGWSIRKFVRTTRRYKTIQIQAGAHVLTAADPLPADLHEALSRIHRDPDTH